MHTYIAKDKTREKKKEKKLKGKKIPSEGVEPMAFVTFTLKKTKHKRQTCQTLKFCIKMLYTFETLNKSNKFRPQSFTLENMLHLKL